MASFTKYQLMETLEKVHLLEFAYKVLPYVEASNPRYIAANFHYWQRGAPDGLPIPSLCLIYKVTSSPSISWFLRSGELSAQSIRFILRRNGFALNDFKAVLDFGCGCGRVIRHLRALTKTELYATDYNPDLINWCKRYLGFAQFTTNRSTPSLGYADDFFDLVYAISVFTHLPESHQLAWVKEFSRILKPKGLLFITTHGEHYLGRLAYEERELFRIGRLIVKRGRYCGTNLCTAFHPEQYVRDRLMKGFEVIDFVPAGMKGVPHQDVYLAKNLKWAIQT